MSAGVGFASLGLWRGGLGGPWRGCGCVPWSEEGRVSVCLNGFKVIDYDLKNNYDIGIQVIFIQLL